MTDLYKREIIDPGGRASVLAKDICFRSHKNCQAIHVIPHQPNNFRGPVGFIWKRHILNEMKNSSDSNWTMAEEVKNDSAGGNPQFFTLVNTPKAFHGLGWEIIARTADNFACSGKFPAVINSKINVKQITEGNCYSFQAMMEGYEDALQESGITNITSEVTIIKHSITAFCDTQSDDQLVLTWDASCIGLAHKDLLIDGSKIKPGMPIVGFLEPGYRYNRDGEIFFTNLLLDRFWGDVDKIMKDPETAEFVKKLTIPSQSYAKTICRVVGWKPDGRVGKPLVKIAGIAHITGGVWEKFKEILPEGVGARLDNMPKPAEVSLETQKMSWDTSLRLTDHQAYSTLPDGCGIFIAVEPEDVARIKAEAKKDGIQSQTVGYIVESDMNEIIIHSKFKEGKILSSERPE